MLNRFLPVVLLMGALACGSKPDKTVMGYLEAKRAMKPAEAYELLAKADKAYQSKDAFVAGEAVPQMAAMVKAINARLRFELKGVETNGDKGKVRVAVTHPDAQVVMGKVMPDVMGAMFTGLGKKDAGKDALEGMADKIAKAVADAPLQTEEQVFDVVKEDGQWKVLMHLADLDRIKELQEKITKLEADDRFEEAGAAAAQVLAIQAGNKGALEAAARLKPKIEASKAASAYIPMIKLGEPKVSTAGFLGWKSIRVQAKNTGDKVVQKIRVVYRLLDKEGKAVAEETDDYGFTKTGPLKPNYEGEGFHKVDGNPASWAGKVEVKVVALTLG